jgi:hypothetical protein
MKKENSMGKNLIKMIALMVLAVIVMVMSVSCDDDDDDNGAPAAGESQLLSSYTYTLDLTGEQQPLVITQTGTDVQRTIEVSSRDEAPVTGTYTPEESRITIAQDTTLLIRAENFLGEAATDYTLTIQEDIVFRGETSLVSEEEIVPSDEALAPEGDGTQQIPPGDGDITTTGPDSSPPVIEGDTGIPGADTPVDQGGAAPGDGVDITVSTEDDPSTPGLDEPPVVEIDSQPGTGRDTTAPGMEDIPAPTDTAGETVTDTQTPSVGDEIDIPTNGEDIIVTGQDGAPPVSQEADQTLTPRESPAPGTVQGEGSVTMEEQVPVQGSYVLTFGGNTITVAFADDAQADRVNVSMNGEDPASFEVDEFESLIDSDAPDWQKRASLSYMVIRLLVDQTLLVVETVDIIEDNRQTLLTDTTVSFDCNEAVLAEGVEEPEFFLPTGNRSLIWLDENENSDVDAGDDFRWEIASCWESAEDDLIDGLANGEVLLSGYVRDMEQRGGQQVLTRFGFDTDDNGGVFFTDLVFFTVEEEGEPGILVFDPVRSFTLNGGFAIVFTEVQQEGS